MKMLTVSSWSVRPPVHTTLPVVHQLTMDTGLGNNVSNKLSEVSVVNPA